MTKAEIITAVSKMNVVELSELVSEMEEIFGVSAAAVSVAGNNAAAPVAAVEEKTEFDVVLTGAGANKIAAIKVVREITSLGLAEAKAVVEAAPKVLKEAISKSEAEALVKKIIDAGAQAEMR
jgi:large subunit ribosomal protein L7/L12